MKKKLLPFSILLLTLLINIKLQAQSVIYVDSSNVNGMQNGQTWATAYNDFQLAIDTSNAGDSIFVAKGIYLPDTTESFTMKDSVKIFGGFSAIDSTFSQRDWENNLTILKGNGNRVINNRFDSLSLAAVIDGFTITGGYVIDFGGGMYNSYSSPTISNVIFLRNIISNRGGAMYNSQSSPILKNVKFIDNKGSLGGAMYNNHSSPEILNTTFKNNRATSSSYPGGGGLCNNYSSSPTLVNVLFIDNKSKAMGGGMGNKSNSSPRLINVMFINNKSDALGGGMGNIYNSSPVLENVVFSNNETRLQGGGMFNEDSSPNLKNVTFYNNKCTETQFSAGGGIYNNGNFSITISNAIFWGNSALIEKDFFEWGSPSTIEYSYTQSAISGIGNIKDTIDPFINSANPAGADGLFMTADDGLQLACSSAAINAGSNAFVSANDTTDIVGAYRIIGNTVDMGAYENTSIGSNQSVTACDTYFWPEANMSYTLSGIYRDTVSNVSNCDSVITLYLTIKKSSADTINITSCNRYTWPMTNITYLNSGYYSDTIATSKANCDSVVTINLNITKADTAVINNETSLTATAKSATFKWLNCDSNFIVIKGATSSNFIPTKNGSYAVQVTQNNCMDTSKCYNLTKVGLVENIFSKNLTIYPNPTNGIFKIDFGQTYRKINIRLTDLTGKVIKEETVSQASIIYIEAGEAKGIYILQINDGNGNTAIIKLIKK